MNLNLLYCACGDAVTRQSLEILRRLPLRENGISEAPRCRWCVQSVAETLEESQLAHQTIRDERNKRIWALSAQGLKQSTIAKQFGLTAGAISKIMSRVRI